MTSRPEFLSELNSIYKEYSPASVIPLALGSQSISKLKVQMVRIVDNESNLIAIVYPERNQIMLKNDGSRVVIDGHIKISLLQYIQIIDGSFSIENK